SGTAKIKATATKDTMISEGTTEIKVINPNASGVTVKYDLNAAFGLLTSNGVVPRSEYITFDTTNGFLGYVTDSRGDDDANDWRIIRANFGGKYVYMVYQNLWICLEVNVPVAGDYSVSMYNGLYRTEKNNALEKLGGVMDVYVFKNEGQTPASGIVAANLIGTVDCSSDTVRSTIVETPSVIKRDHSFDAGKYYIVLRTQDIETCNEFGIVGDILLDGGDGEALMGNITLGADELTTGVATTVTANGYSSKTGSALDVEDFVYSSSNPAVASVNGENITINGAGKATISATSEIYGRTITKDITVNDITEATFGYFINDVNMGSVTSSTGADVGEVASIKLGTPVTLTAEAADGYEFKYWETPLGNKFGEEITFAVTSNMSCRAVFGEKPADGSIAINFYNGNRDWLSMETVTKDTLWSAIEKPSQPSILGFEFSNWAYIKNGVEKAAEDTDTFTEDTNVVAKYSEDGNEVTYNGENVKYAEPIVGETNGSPVKCWKRGDKIVSYAQEYTFFANGIADAITPVYEGEFIATPIAVLESYNGQYMLEYDVPSGYTKLEAGIIYGSNKDTLKVNSYYSKAVAKNEEAHGQFTAIPNGADAEMETVARGYVIYKTADGCIGVAYSN
ncbi:MAG: hypothetical protein IJF32_08510, partial [Oscillospiraceae bacterium]|nr:hypothetical protein [Oscillospiraceae bacterium]